MSDTDTILQALAQVIYQAGRLDERGLAVAPLDPPLDALPVEARETFDRLDRLGTLPVVDMPRVGDEAPPAAGPAERPAGAWAHDPRAERRRPERRQRPGHG